MALGEKYSWTQTSKQITIFVPLLSTITRKDVVCTLSPTCLILGINGEKPVIDGLLKNAVDPDDSRWDIEEVDGKLFLRAVIQKAEEKIIWNSLLNSLKICQKCGVSAYKMKSCPTCTWFGLKWLVEPLKKNFDPPHYN